VAATGYNSKQSPVAGPRRYNTQARRWAQRIRHLWSYFTKKAFSIYKKRKILLFLPRALSVNACSYLKLKNEFTSFLLKTTIYKKALLKFGMR